MRGHQQPVPDETQLRFVAFPSVEPRVGVYSREGRPIGIISYRRLGFD